MCTYTLNCYTQLFLIGICMYEYWHVYMHVIYGIQCKVCNVNYLKLKHMYQIYIQSLTLKVGQELIKISTDNKFVMKKDIKLNFFLFYYKKSYS